MPYIFAEVRRYKRGERGAVAGGNRRKQQRKFAAAGRMAAWSIRHCCPMPGRKGSPGRRSRSIKFIDSMALARGLRLRASARVSMTWMTPFDCMTLAMVMRALPPLASVTIQADRSCVKRQLFALHRLERGGAVMARGHGCDLAGGDAAGDDVIGQDAGQRALVLGLDQRLDRAGGQLGEGGIGRREHGERTLARQRVDQAGGLDRGDQRRVILRIDGILDDVLGRIHRGAADHRVLGERAAGQGQRHRTQRGKRET